MLERLTHSEAKFWRRVRAKDKRRDRVHLERWKSFDNARREVEATKQREQDGKSSPPPILRKPHEHCEQHRDANTACDPHPPHPCEHIVIEETEGMTIRRAYRLLDRLRQISNNRTARCRRFRLNKEVQVFSDGERSWVNGVQSCNNVWGCPVCAAIIQSRRAAEIDYAIDSWIRYGLDRKGPSTAHAYMVTLTVRHGLTHRLETTSQLVADAWSEIFSGRAGQAIRAELGIRHTVRALEPTYGEANGWHPHLHVIIMTDRELTDADLARLKERWADAVSIHSFEAAFAPSDERGVTLRELYQSRDGRYVQKMFLELQAYDTKEGKNGNITYWQVARRAADGDRRYMHIWQEAQAALFRRKQLTWSHGSKAWFGIADLSDGDINDEDGVAVESLENVYQMTISGPTWDRAWRADRLFLSTLLGCVTEAVKVGNYAAVIPLTRHPVTGEPCSARLERVRREDQARTTPVGCSDIPRPHAACVSMIC